MSDNLTRENPDARSFEERVFARFDALDARLTSLETKVDGLDARLTSLEEKVDARLRETRPMWESVQARLEGIESALRETNRALRLVHNDILRVRVEQEGLEERIEKLESEPAR